MQQPPAFPTLLFHLIALDFPDYFWQLMSMFVRIRRDTPAYTSLTGYLCMRNSAPMRKLMMLAIISADV